MSIIEVAIRPGASVDTFLVQVVRSSTGGEASAAVKLDTSVLHARRTELEHAVLRSGVATRRILDETERCIRGVGQELFLALLGSGEVAGQYRANAAVAAKQEQGLRVVLRIEDPILAGLPWEAMYDDALGTYVCRRDQLVRHIPVPSTAAPLPVNLPLRILGVISSPRDLRALDTDKEKAQLATALGSLSDQRLIEMHWAPSPTWADLQDLLLSGHWHVVHFIGHGDFDAARDEGVLALVGEDGRADLVEASRLVDLMRQTRPMPRMVVLNSCAGAATGVEDLFSGTAAALVRGGVSAVAAMQYEISNAAAVAFAHGFYSALAHGRGVDEAVSSGRVAILGTSSQTLEWITPVLYLRGDESHLFTVMAKNLGAEPQERGSQAEQGLLHHAYAAEYISLVEQKAVALAQGFSKTPQEEAAIVAALCFDLFGATEVRERIFMARLPDGASAHTVQQARELCAAARSLREKVSKGGRPQSWVWDYARGAAIDHTWQEAWPGCALDGVIDFVVAPAYCVDSNILLTRQRVFSTTSPSPDSASRGSATRFPGRPHD